MKIVSIEPTPSPHSMKLNLDDSLPAGHRRSYTKENEAGAPEYARKLLAIPGVAGVFHTADFIAVDRHPKADWPPILTAAKEVLGVASGAAAAGPGGTAAGGGPGAGGTVADAAAAAFGEAQVLVQTFRRIPMQVRVRQGGEERRAAMPARFTEAAMGAGLASQNLIRERRLEEHGMRYGEPDDILEEIVRELDAAYDEERISALVAEAERMNQAEAEALARGEAGAAEARSAAMRETSAAELEAAFAEPDWRRRYAALERFRPTPESVPLLARALDDPQMSVRRLAAVYLGDLKGPEVLPHLYKALSDASPVVRRTAGDTLSDLGDPAAIPAMVKALGDPNKLVRWRAARFLYESGDESALPALIAAEDDPEFEVRLQIRMAIERIQGGEAAAGSVWQQMMNRPKD